MKHIKKRVSFWQLALGVCGIGLVAVGVAFVLTGQNYLVNAVDYVGDRTSLRKSNADAHAVIEEYTSFQSVPDVFWESGASRVGLLLANPQGNPVDMVPMVYVDCDDDGKFSDNEIVWNAKHIDKNPQSLAPGTHLDEIDLEREVPTGEHRGQVVFSAFHIKTQQQANGMTMDFRVKVG